MKMRKRKKYIYTVQVHNNWKWKKKENHRYHTNLHGNKMDNFIIPENERKPEKFPDIRSQKEEEEKKNLLCEVTHRETTEDNS